GERAADLSCKVQVKAVLTGTTRARISLANWERMVRAPMPFFVVVFIVDASGEDLRTVDTYVVHVDKKWIERTLRRLRELDTTSEDVLNEKVIYLTWSDDEKLPSLSCFLLNTRIMDIVGTDVHGYIRDKSPLLNSCGYEERPIMG